MYNTHWVWFHPQPASLAAGRKRYIASKTVTRKFPIGGLYVWSVGLDILKFDKNYRFTMLHNSISGAKPPVATGLPHGL